MKRRSFLGLLSAAAIAPAAARVVSSSIEPVQPALSVEPSYAANLRPGQLSPQLVLTPYFPDPPQGWWYEFWCRREDGEWYLLGYPGFYGPSGAAYLHQIPKVAHEWEFAFVPTNSNTPGKLLGPLGPGALYCSRLVEPPFAQAVVSASRVEMWAHWGTDRQQLLGWWDVLGRYNTV